jgi:hypothetical protein
MGGLRQRLLLARELGIEFVLKDFLLLLHEHQLREQLFLRHPRRSLLCAKHAHARSMVLRFTCLLLLLTDGIHIIIPTVNPFIY